MQITINQTNVDVCESECLLEIARRIGCNIPSMCYARGAVHRSSCMVCVVKDCVTGQIIPSCTTFPEEGMQIETESEELYNIRNLSLELLLSDHRADCEAPCSMVCPQQFDIEYFLKLYDSGNTEESVRLISSTFTLSNLECVHCKAPCEKVCRRGTVDKAVSIRKIISELASTCQPVETGKVEKDDVQEQFQSRIGRFTTIEKEWLKDNIVTRSGCLHCACAGREGCKLRLYATNAGIKRPRYETSSNLPVMKKTHVIGKMWFEPAKCIRCGLCVYNSKNGFTFQDRGFVMQVVIPDENRINVNEKLAELCPTGALYC